MNWSSKFSRRYGTLLPGIHCTCSSSTWSTCLWWGQCIDSWVTHTLFLYFCRFSILHCVEVKVGLVRPWCILTAPCSILLVRSVWPALLLREYCRASDLWWWWCTCGVLILVVSEGLPHWCIEFVSFCWWLCNFYILQSWGLPRRWTWPWPCQSPSPCMSSWRFVCALKCLLSSNRSKDTTR